MRYANQAAADLLGCATPEELLAKPLGTIFAQWESTHEDGRPMVAEDVPSYKIVNGQPAEPLLTRIVQPRDRRAALAAGQGRAPARQRRRDDGRQRDRGRHRGQGGRAAPALPGPGGHDALLLAGLRGDPAARGAAGRARPGRLVRGRRRRRQPAPQPRRRRARRPRQGRLRARAAQPLSAGPRRGLGALRRAALRPARALPRAPRRAARAEHRGSRAARDHPRAGHALGHAHPDGRRRAHDRRADDGVGRERALPSTRTTSSSRATWRAERRRPSRTRACTPSARPPR